MRTKPLRWAPCVSNAVHYGCADNLKLHTSLALVLVALAIPRLAVAAPSVWAIDDGEKIKQDATNLRFEEGTDNPVWSPGQPIRLFSLKNETVAMQIVVEADDATLDGVTVELDALAGPGGATVANAPGATDPTKFVGRPIERFVEHWLDIRGASTNTGGPTSSLGWAEGSGPAPGKWTGRMPDALIPIEVAPAWASYPMRIAAKQNGIVWIDVTMPADRPAGLYTGNVVVKSSAGPIATIPFELQLVDVTLPEQPVKTMLVYDRGELDRRIGGDDAAELHLWQLLHRHRLTPVHAARTLEEAKHHLPALDGTAFSSARGYEGPGADAGDGLLVLGLYGGLGAPSAANLKAIEQIADELAKRNVLAKSDVFVYAADEDCSSPYGKGWKDLLASSTNANVKSVKVGWTCGANPTKQPVDIPMLLDTYDPETAAAAKALGKDVWVYNGMRPFNGTFLTDSEAVSLRANGWLSGMFDISRWFYWETTFWYDDNRGGQGAYDPFVSAETFHNDQGDTANGDGLLLYPGKQIDEGTTHSIGMDGVIASLRMKNWRRGIEDAGYYQLARAKDPAKAEAVAKALLPKVFTATSGGKPVSWTDVGKPWFDARKELLAIFAPDALVQTDQPGTATPGDPSAVTTESTSGCGCHTSGNGGAATGAGMLGALVALALLQRRRSRNRRAITARRWPARPSLRP